MYLSTYVSTYNLVDQKAAKRGPIKSFRSSGDGVRHCRAKFIRRHKARIFMLTFKVIFVCAQTASMKAYLYSRITVEHKAVM